MKHKHVIEEFLTKYSTRNEYTAMVRVHYNWFGRIKCRVTITRNTKTHITLLYTNRGLIENINVFHLWSDRIKVNNILTLALSIFIGLVRLKCNQ